MTDILQRVDEAWTARNPVGAEWRWDGHQADGSVFAMRGVTVQDLYRPEG